MPPIVPALTSLLLVDWRPDVQPHCFVKCRLPHSCSGPRPVEAHHKQDARRRNAASVKVWGSHATYACDLASIVGGFRSGWGLKGKVLDEYVDDRWHLGKGSVGARYFAGVSEIS